MNRATLNGLQPRDSREIAPDPFDWTDAPLFGGKDDSLTIAQLLVIVVGVLCALIALAVKFGVGA